jgi:hypothetical protein
MAVTAAASAAVGRDRRSLYNRGRDRRSLYNRGGPRRHSSIDRLPEAQSWMIPLRALGNLV